MPDAVNALIGSDSGIITWWQMCVRAALIFLVAVLLLRLGSTRIFGRNASLDIVLSVILGSILSRALTGNSSFFPTLGAAVILVLMHRLFAEIAFRFERFGRLVKGRETRLVVDNEIQWDAMRRTHITRNDLLESLRETGGRLEISAIKEAYLERNGNISIILHRDRP